MDTKQIIGLKICEQTENVWENIKNWKQKKKQKKPKLKTKRNNENKRERISIFRFSSNKQVQYTNISTGVQNGRLTHFNMTTTAQ